MVTAGSKYLCRGFLVAALAALVGSAARADLFVSSVDFSTVVQYDENTGAFLNVFTLGGDLSGPRGVLIGSDGTIGSWLAKGPEAIRSLVAGGVGLPVLHPALRMASANGTPRAPAPPPQNPAGLQIGAPTPNFSLPDLNGTPVSLARSRSFSTTDG